MSSGLVILYFFVLWVFFYLALYRVSNIIYHSLWGKLGRLRDSRYTSFWSLIKCLSLKNNVSKIPHARLFAGLLVKSSVNLWNTTIIGGGRREKRILRSLYVLNQGLVIHCGNYYPILNHDWVKLQKMCHDPYNYPSFTCWEKWSNSCASCCKIGIELSFKIMYATHVDFPVFLQRVWQRIFVTVYMSYYTFQEWVNTFTWSFYF